MNEMSAVFWLAAAVLLFIVETVTYQMVCIWFSAGAVIALVAGFLGAPSWGQLLTFLLASVVSLLVFRPLVRSKVRVKKSPTNADRVIGQIGIVREEINNELQTGRVYANGMRWAARSVQSGVTIPPDSRVRVVRIEGVTLMVEPAEV